MKDAQTYRQYAEECRKLADALPKHRTHLREVAVVWTDLAGKAEKKEASEPTITRTK
jgi:hypothetical protein